MVDLDLIWAAVSGAELYDHAEGVRGNDTIKAITGEPELYKPSRIFGFCPAEIARTSQTAESHANKPIKTLAACCEGLVADEPVV